MDIYLKIAEAYKNLGDENGFIQACTQAMNLEGDGEQAVMILADYYLERDRKETPLRFCRHRSSSRNPMALSGQS